MGNYPSPHGGLIGDRISAYGFQLASRSYLDGIEPKTELHDRPGVYAISCASMRYCAEIDSFVQCGSAHLLYIGCSKRVSTRLGKPGHWLERIKEKMFTMDQDILVHVLYTEDYLITERLLIKGLHPKLNIHHNGERLY